MLPDGVYVKKRERAADLLHDFMNEFLCIRGGAKRVDETGRGEEMRRDEGSEKR